MRIGAHVSIAGGLCKAVTKALRIKADCIQIFLSSPRSWAPIRCTAEDIGRFTRERKRNGIDPLFIHTIYLLNLASPCQELRKRSIDSLVAYMRAAVELGADSVVTHLGSAGQASLDQAEDMASASLAEALARVEGGVVLIETSAGAGASVGSDFAQIGRIVRRLGESDRIGVCLDTAHIFAAGYDIATELGLEHTLLDLDKHVGLDRLRLVHANDSKAPLGSCIDRHENIGRGYLGKDAFRRLLRHPILQRMPFIIEVPGFDQEGLDIENIALLRELAGEQLVR